MPCRVSSRLGDQIGGCYSSRQVNIGKTKYLG
uniref:Uncharacterized protein n=1 Tax=Arundo donax TaxID=35708 RepID=A0A0A9BUS0_ARUDO